MRIAAIYARVSGDQQQRDSNTISSQTEALIAYANKHGYRVAGTSIPIHQIAGVNNLARTRRRLAPPPAARHHSLTTTVMRLSPTAVTFRRTDSPRRRLYHTRSLLRLLQHRLPAGSLADVLASPSTA
ncbi:MAG: recombinase family protein [Deltaproteobacteria bacterium]|nr:recombinase family protein [Deltaproteobacteria bacterium]